MPKGKVLAGEGAVSEAAYSEVLHGLELEQIGIVSFSGEVLRFAPLWEENSQARSKLSASASYHNGTRDSADAQRVLVDQMVDIEVSDQEGVLMRLAATFRLQYRTSVLFNDPIFNRFKQNELLVHCVPFVREWVLNCCDRMHTPPIMIPLYKTGLAAAPRTKKGSKKGVEVPVSP